MSLSDEMAAWSEANTFAKRNHITLVEVGPDRAVTELTADRDSLNPYGMVHGGALYTMADNACGIAARSGGDRYVTLSSSFNFLHSGMPGDVIRAEAVVRRRGRTTCYVEVDLTNQKGELLSSGSFTFYKIQ